MHFTQILRTNPNTGAIERPWRQSDRENNRMFVLADPAHGAQRHHKDNAVMVATYSEALELVRSGFSIRMSDGRSAPTLISPGSLEFVDEPVKRLDELWTYTMPEPPFSLETVMKDLRQHLIAQASDIQRIADKEAASAFIGFAFDTLDDSDDPKALERIDLEGFNISRIVRVAYESAFRPWQSDEISEDDVDELEQIIGGSIVRFGRRHYSPMDSAGSALQRTVLAAYYRWQIVDGVFLSRDEIDHSATEAIGVLTGMPAHAVRNALSRDGISLVKSKIDRPALIDWIVTRRNFAPLRLSETWEERAAWRVRHEIVIASLPDALLKIRSMYPEASPDLAAAEEVITARRQADEIPTNAELRRYSAALGIAPDNLILELNKHWSAR